MHFKLVLCLQNYNFYSSCIGFDYYLFSSDARKMCKKLKVSPEPFTLKHYKDGEFHKDYDRLLTIQSMVSFMRDPTGDVPWEEDSTAGDVVHIPDTLVSNYT